MTGRVVDTDLFSRVSGLSLPEAAPVYAGAGVPVFPCVPGAKRPLTEHGFHDASTDPARVAAWWSRWPQANIGIPTGAVSGLEVVDVDVHDSASGFAAFQRARRGGLVTGWAALVRTPSGGVHAYYPAESGGGQASWQAPRARVDFRGTGGYVVAPPSAVATARGRAGSYGLIATTTTTPAPVDAAALREFLDPRSQPAVGAGPVRGADAERLAAWVAARGEGERNRALFWAACRMAENGVPHTEALDVLVPAAERAGLGQREIAATVRSAYRATRMGPVGRDVATPRARDDAARVSSRDMGQVLS